MRLLNLACQYCNASLTSLNDSVTLIPPKSIRDYRFCIKAFARRKSAKKLRREYGQSRNGMVLKGKDMGLANESNVLSDGSCLDDDLQKSNDIPTRIAVLQACTFTSAFLAALGILIRQVSHFASVEGLPIIDCSTQVSCIRLVILISSCRYLLLKTWPDFAESSEAANQQVLTSLQPLDYIVVSFFPGISEELLFRGALLPLLGMDWKSTLATASIFGVLHLGSGRKYSFAIWATFVGLVYGYAAIVSSSIIVPMASHALNNLVGGILWRSTSKSLSNSLD